MHFRGTKTRFQMTGADVVTDFRFSSRPKKFSFPLCLDGVDGS